jgi:hypothetical protein
MRRLAPSNGYVPPVEISAEGGIALFFVGKALALHRASPVFWVQPQVPANKLQVERREAFSSIVDVIAGFVPKLGFST